MGDKANPSPNPVTCLTALVLLVALPFLSLASAWWESYAILKIWRWHLTAYAEPWPQSAIVAAILIIGMIRSRYRPTKRGKANEAAWKDIGGRVFYVVVTPAFAMFIAWWMR